MGKLSHLSLFRCLTTTGNSYLSCSWFYGHRRKTTPLNHMSFKRIRSTKIYRESNRSSRWNVLSSKEEWILGIYEKSFHWGWFRWRRLACWRSLRLLFSSCIALINLQLNHKIHMLKSNMSSDNRQKVQLLTLGEIWIVSFGEETCWKTHV